MSTIFDKMKKLTPYHTCLKAKENPPYMIVTNEELDIFYLNESSALFFKLCNFCLFILK